MYDKFSSVGYGYGEAKRQLLSDEEAQVSFKKKPFPEQYAFDAVLMNLSEIVHTPDQEMASRLWKGIAEIAKSAGEYLE